MKETCPHCGQIITESKAELDSKAKVKRLLKAAIKISHKKKAER